MLIEKIIDVLNYQKIYFTIFMLKGEDRWEIIRTSLPIKIRKVISTRNYNIIDLKYDLIFDNSIYFYLVHG